MPESYEEERRKKRVTAIALEIVESRVLKGEVNMDDAAAMEAAVKDAVETAAAAYDAAEEYVRG
jgi:hypothetical protein